MKTFTQLEDKFWTLWRKYEAEHPEDEALSDLCLKWWKGACIEARRLENDKIIGVNASGKFIED